MTVTKTNNTISVPTIDNVIGNKKKNTPRKIDELIKKDDEITLKDLAPDNGRGWIIVLAMIFISMTTISQTQSFGIIFSDFFEASGRDGMTSNLSTSLFISGCSIGSLLTNILLKRYSTRPVGILGALCFSVSTILLAFIRNMYDLAFLFLFQGFGLGLIITVCNTILNTYFVKKRMKVRCTGVYAIIGLGGIIYFTSVVKMMTLYGFRGTIAIMGAISLNSIVGMLLMHPTEWHVKKLDDVRAEKARIKQYRFQELALSNRRSTIDVIHTSSKTKWNSLHSLKEECDAEMPLLNKTLKPSAQRVASNFEIEGEIREREKSVSMRESLARRVSDPSASSLVNVTISVGALSDIRQQYLEKKSWEEQMNKEIQEQKEHEKQDIEEKQKGIKYKVILGELLDMSLIKNCDFLILCSGVCLVCSIDNAFFFCIPLIMGDAGYTKDDITLTLTISTIVEVASKMLLTVFTLIVDIKAKYLFFAITIVMNFPRLGFLLHMDTLMGARIMIALIGLVRSWFVLQFLVIIEDINTDKFASAYGISGIIGGLFSIVFGTIAGLIKDWTGSFYMYQVCQLVFHNALIIPWGLQFIFVDFKKWRKQRAQETITKSLI
ncbi:monocarboxylate transporter 9 isoform X1 [Camponotus floridanus]|uniref:monocarboxylate transporter 9 isoform X1 n=1 Tax=Camponotus floridanus TaxID=104421 RepID=UPI000DC66E67|nr:monocarboxylate transporter 9 isoform X1 [Camponotus floridanus]XP_025266151.1 monocarboxylate transporter 9 isoform X1 [Camponotus floridanus]